MFTAVKTRKVKVYIFGVVACSFISSFGHTSVVPERNNTATLPTITTQSVSISRLDALVDYAASVNLEVVISNEKSLEELVQLKNKTYHLEEFLTFCLQGTSLIYEINDQQIRITPLNEPAVKLRPITIHAANSNTENSLIENASTLNSFSLSNRIAKPMQSVSSKYLERSHAKSLENSIDYISGIEYLQSNTGVHSKFYARGIPAIFTVDGNPHRRPPGSIDPFFLERIDVVHGATVNFVSQGATLNFVTKKPNRKNSQVLELSSNNDNRYRIASDTNRSIHPNSDSNFRLISLYEKEENRTYYHDEKYAIAPSFSTSLYSHDDLLVSMYHSQQKKYPSLMTYHDSVLGYEMDRDKVLGASWANSHTSDSHIAIHYSNPITENNHISVESNWSRYTLDSIVTAPTEPLSESSNNYSQDGDTLLIQYSQKGVRYLSYGLDLSLESMIDMGSNSLLINYGIDGQVLDQMTPHYPAVYLEDPFNIYHPNHEIEQRPVTNRGKLSHRMTSLGASTSIYYPLNNLVQLSLDLRYDDTSFRLDDYREDSTTQIFDWKLNGKFEKYSGELGVSFTLPSNIKIYGSYSQSHSYQPVVDATQISDPYNVSADILPPIENEQYEISLTKSDFDDQLQTQVIWYSINSQNVQSFGRTDDTFINTELRDRNSKGFTIDITGRLSDTVNLIANYSRNLNVHGIVNAANYLNFDIYNSADSFESKQAESTATSIANIWLEYKNEKRNFQDYTISIGAKYVGERYGDANNTFTLAPYRRFDSTINYTGFKNTELAFSIKNIFNTYYYKGSNGGKSLVEIGEGRTLFLTLRKKI